jgi:T5SS/PEP-CTERM-associated repeat protein
MIKRVSVLVLVVALSGAAHAEVVWNWVGSEVAPRDWNVPGNWSVAGTTTYTYPSQQYVGVSPEFPPDYRYINSDVTAINITNGDLVEKIVEDGTGFTSSYHLTLGGNNCTLTVSNAGSQLHIGRDFYVGEGVGANATVNVSNGGVLDTDHYLLMGYDGGTCHVNVTTGSTLNADNAARLGHGGGTGTMLVDGAGTSFVGDTSFWLGEGENSKGYLTISNGAAVSVGTSFQMGRGGGSHAELTMTGGASLTTGSDFNVAYNASCTATATITDSSITCKSWAAVGNLAGSEGTMTLDNSSFTMVDDVNNRDLYVGSNCVGTMNVKNGSTATIDYRAFVGYTADIGDGRLNISGGSTVSSGNDLVLAYYLGSKGALSITGGGVYTAGDDIFIGYQGPATATVSGAGSLLTCTGDDVYLGNVGSATITIEDGGQILSAGDDMMIPNATVNVNGGTLANTGDMIAVGITDGYTGTVNIDGGGAMNTLNGGGRIYVGYGGGSGRVNVTNGTLASDLDLRLAHGSGDATTPGMGTAKGFLNVYEHGVVNVGRDFETGSNANSTSQWGNGLEATVHIYDGDVNVNGYMCLGYQAKGGTITNFIVDDGTVDVGLAPDTLSDLILGWYDTDANVDLVLNGGSMTIAGAIYMGRTTDATGAAITNTGSNSGVIRVTIDGGVLQAEDYIDAGSITNHLITFKDGQLKINGLNVSEAEMLALITGGDITCPNGYVIYTEDAYTVLALTEAPPIPGDANDDGKVNADDAAKLAAYWGITSGAEWGDGDFNGDGKVNAADASILAANWGHGMSESTSVPEPSVLCLLAGALSLFLGRRWRGEV